MANNAERINGDLKPVAVYDSASFENTGVDAVTSGVTVQPQGPKLDFFTVTASGALTGAQVSTILKVVGQLATVHMYQYVDATNDSVAVAIYPVGGWSAAGLQTAVVAAGLTGATAATGAAFA